MTKSYPPTYGKPTRALPDIEGPLNIDQEGDTGVPPNDMAEVADGLATGKKVNDPLGLLKGID